MAVFECVWVSIAYRHHHNCYHHRHHKTTTADLTSSRRHTHPFTEQVELVGQVEQVEVERSVCWQDSRNIEEGS
ncbi:hypothetical protein E2C01_032141 [Portunus trituberculatus]|uniref:Uncharacterized protein n=1 Tax=Portunus trituberculatus TaxID=210409 RepID=A0A5B7EUL9_PORTR|nr:hypothetical protein [Portunus trituberculatus]